MSHLLVNSSSLFVTCKGIYLDSDLDNKMHLGTLVLEKSNQPTNQAKRKWLWEKHQRVVFDGNFKFTFCHFLAGVNFLEKVP